MRIIIIDRNISISQLFVYAIEGTLRYVMDNHTSSISMVFGDRTLERNNGI